MSPSVVILSDGVAGVGQEASGRLLAPLTSLIDASSQNLSADLRRPRSPIASVIGSCEHVPNDTYAPGPDARGRPEFGTGRPSIEPMEGGAPGGSDPGDRAERVSG